MAQVTNKQIQVFSQTSDPLVTDDNTKGYQVSNVIVNTSTDTAFICVDASTGAAIWHIIDHSSGGIWTRSESVHDEEDEINGVIQVANNGDDVDLSTSGNLYVSSSATQTLSATDTLFSGNSVIYVQGSGGPVTLTSNPQIAQPTDPTICMYLAIIGTSDTNTLTFVNGNGVVLHSGSSITLGQSDILVLIWDEVNNIYVQQDVAQAGGGSALPLNNIFYFNSAGNDTNDGQSNTTAFATLPAAISAVNALTPTPSNRFEIRGPGGMEITTDVTLPPYTLVNTPATRYPCQVTGSDGSSLIYYGGLTGLSSGFNPCFAKTGTTDIFTVTAVNKIEAQQDLTSGGSASEAIVINAPEIYLQGNQLVSNESGNLFINCEGDIYNSTGAGPIFSQTGGSAGNIYVRARNINENTSAGGPPSILISNGSTITLDIYAYNSPARPIYALSNNSVLNSNAVIWDDDFGTNTVDATSELNLNVMKRTQPFSNLGATPVNTFRFQKNRIYKIMVEATDGRVNVFQLEVGYNPAIPELLSQLLNGAAAYNGPMGVINYLNTAGTDQYTININGFANSYILTITRATGVATFAASGATTGTTRLYVNPTPGI